MAYPTDSLSMFLRNLDSEMIGLKRTASQAKARLEAGSVSASQLIDLVITLRRIRATLETIAGKPGLAAYAKDVKNDQNLDVVAEYVAVRNAVDACVSWVLTNFPTDGSGYLLREQWGQDGPIDRTFGTVATAPLAALLGTIDTSIA